MAITRANAEFMIVAEVSPLLVAADMAVTVVGSNADLNGPLGKAIRSLGHAVASPVLVADADVAQVTDAQLDEFLGIATLNTLEAILRHLDDVDIKVGSDAESLSQLAERVEREVARLRTSLERDFGYGRSVPQMGYITIDRVEHG